MADDFKKREELIKKAKNDLKKLDKDLKELSPANVKKQVADLRAAFKAVEDAEDEIIKALPAARKAGVTGTDIKSFKRDKSFKNVFEAYDKKVTELDKIEKVCYNAMNNSKVFATEVGNIRSELDKGLKSLKEYKAIRLIKDASFDKFLDELKDHLDDLTDSSKEYDITKERRIHLYATNFDKRVQKLLDLAPPPPTPQLNDLPDDLTPANLDAILKLAKETQKKIEKSHDNVERLIEGWTPQFEKMDDSTRDAKRRKVLQKLDPEVDGSEKALNALAVKGAKIVKLLDQNEAKMKANADAIKADPKMTKPKDFLTLEEKQKFEDEYLKCYEASDKKNKAIAKAYAAMVNLMK